MCLHLTWERQNNTSPDKTVSVWKHVMWKHLPCFEWSGMSPEIWSNCRLSLFLWLTQVGHFHLSMTLVRMHVHVNVYLSVWVQAAVLSCLITARPIKRNPIRDCSSFAVVKYINTVSQSAQCTVGVLDFEI